LEIAQSGVPTEIVSQLVTHEYYGHAANDEVGKGEFGFRTGGGYIIAYYLIIGDRTPEQMMKIASGPGFGEMSGQDWNIYNQAWGEWLEEQQKEKFETLKKESEKKSDLPDQNNSESPYDPRVRLVEKFAEKLNKLEKEGRFPSFDQIAKSDLKDLFDKYGIAIKWAYREALREIENDRLDDTRKGEFETSDVLNGTIYVALQEEYLH
jgi:hypothetical protein